MFRIWDSVVEIAVNEGFKLTVAASGHREGCFTLGLAKSTAFQNYLNHLIRTLRTCTRVGFWVDLGGGSPSLGNGSFCRVGMASPFFSLPPTETRRIGELRNNDFTYFPLIIDLSHPGQHCNHH